MLRLRLGAVRVGGAREGEVSAVPAIVSGAAVMAVSLLLGAPYWFAGCLLVGIGVGFASTSRGGDRK